MLRLPARSRTGAVEEVFRAVNKRHSPYGYELELRGAAGGQRARRRRLRGRHLPLPPAQPGGALADGHQPRPLPALALPDRLARRASPRCACGGSPTGRSRRSPLTSSELVLSGLRRRPRRGRRAFCARCGMPLVDAGGEPLDEPLSDAHERARKIDPRYAEGQLVRVAGGRNQAEAELIQGLLLEEGVPSMLRRTRRASTCPTSWPPGRATCSCPRPARRRPRERAARARSGAARRRRRRAPTRSSWSWRSRSAGRARR